MFDNRISSFHISFGKNYKKMSTGSSGSSGRGRGGGNSAVHSVLRLGTFSLQQATEQDYSHLVVRFTAPVYALASVPTKDCSLALCLSSSTIATQGLERVMERFGLQGHIHKVGLGNREAVAISKYELEAEAQVQVQVRDTTNSVSFRALLTDAKAGALINGYVSSPITAPTESAVTTLPIWKSAGGGPCSAQLDLGRGNSVAVAAPLGSDFTTAQVMQVAANDAGTARYRVLLRQNHDTVPKRMFPLFQSPSPSQSSEQPLLVTWDRANSILLDALPCVQLDQGKGRPQNDNGKCVYICIMLHHGFVCNHCMVLHISCCYLQLCFCFQIGCTHWLVHNSQLQIVSIWTKQAGLIPKRDHLALWGCWV